MAKLKLIALVIMLVISSKASADAGLTPLAIEIGDEFTFIYEANYYYKINDTIYADLEISVKYGIVVDAIIETYMTPLYRGGTIINVTVIINDESFLAFGYPDTLEHGAVHFIESMSLFSRYNMERSFKEPEMNNDNETIDNKIFAENDAPQVFVTSFAPYYEDLVSSYQESYNDEVEPEEGVIIISQSVDKNMEFDGSIFTWIVDSSYEEEGEHFIGESYNFKYNMSVDVEADSERSVVTKNFLHYEHLYTLGNASDEMRFSESIREVGILDSLPFGNPLVIITSLCFIAIIVNRKNSIL